MLVVMLCQPGTGFWLPEGRGPLNDAGKAPDIGIQKHRPAISAQQLTCGFGAGLDQAVDEIKQRVGGFRQIRDLRRLVIHLQVDVNEVVGARKSTRLNSSYV